MSDQENSEKKLTLGEESGSEATGNLFLEARQEHDSVNPYFQEVGRISLLTREQEIQIAKRIENGQNKIARALLHSPVTITEVFRFGEQRCPGKVRDVARDSAEEVYCVVGSRRQQRVREIIERIAALSQQLRFLQSQGHLASEGAKKEEEIFQQMEDIFRELSLSDRQIDTIVLKLKSYVERIEQAEKAAQNCGKLSGLSPEDIHGLVGVAKNDLPPLPRAGSSPRAKDPSSSARALPVHPAAAVFARSTGERCIDPLAEAAPRSPRAWCRCRHPAKPRACTRPKTSAVSLSP